MRIGNPGTPLHVGSVYGSNDVYHATLASRPDIGDVVVQEPGDDGSKTYLYVVTSLVELPPDPDGINEFVRRVRWKCQLRHLHTIDAASWRMHQ